MPQPILPPQLKQGSGNSKHQGLYFQVLHKFQEHNLVSTFTVGAPKTSYWFSKEKQGYALGIYAGLGNIGPGVLNCLIPVLIGVVGLAAAYLSWLLFLVFATIVYAFFAMDSYYFQLKKKGETDEVAQQVGTELGQDVFPSGST